MKKISTIFIIYIIFCSAIAFVDIDWNAEREQSVKPSMYKQTLYMSRPQLQVYLDDLSTIDSVNMMGGMNGKHLHGKEVGDIHDLANEIRRKNGKELIEFPSKPIIETVSDFFVIPFHIFFDRK